MSKNTELLSGILTCMIRLTDKLHATNNKMIDLNDKFNNISFENFSSLSSKFSEIDGKISTISGQVINFNISADLEKFIDENELEERLDQLSIEDIDVNNKDLIEKIKLLEEFNVSGNIGIIENPEKFIDENELEERLDQLSIEDIDVNNKSLVKEIQSLNNEINNEINN